MVSMSRGRIVASALLSFCLAAIAIFITMALHPDNIGAEQRLAIPANQPNVGLVYNGLQVGTVDVCPGNYQIAGTDFCTHGPDPAPRNVDIKTSVVALGGFDLATTQTNGIVCDGNGVSGNRFEVLYVRTQSKADRYAQYLSTFRSTVGGVNEILNASAAETGGVRHLRLVTDGNCEVAVTRVAVADSAIADFGAMVGELDRQGFNRADRKYIIFMDANTYCGVGTVAMHADEKSNSNPNNFGPSYARVDSGCWVSFALAHEVMHGLGGVLASAPNATENGHCTDTYDVMCYVDAPGVKLVNRCSNNAYQDRFDCNHDDYFHTNPAPGSYLATHWNAADNQFLLQTGPAFVAASIPTEPSASPSATPSVAPSVAPSATPSPAASAKPSASPSAAPRSVLTVKSVSGGTVTIASSAPYLVGQTVVLSPVPANGQVFLGWQIESPTQRATNGPISSWMTPLEIVLAGDTVVTPVFGARPALGDVQANTAGGAEITQLAALGIIRGYANGNYGVNDQTQRAQMAALIVRAMGWGDENYGTPFVDGRGVDANLWRNVGTLAHYGVSNGYDGVRFGPTDTVTQLQVISFITRAMIVKGYWTPVAADGAYAAVPAAHRADLATFHHYAGNWSADNTPSTRGWFAQTLYLALDSVYGR